MIRRFLVLSLLVLLCLRTGSGQETKKEELRSDPKKAVFVTAEDGGRDYALQGEYTGTVGDAKWGAQVVAKGDGKFEIYFLSGGLPGAGWDTKTRTKIDAKTTDEKTAFDGTGWKGTLTSTELKGAMDRAEFTFKKVERKSPTVEAAPPAGATVLFDGKTAANWNNGKIEQNGYLMVGTASKQKYNMAALHLEFRTPFQPKAGGQGRGNSGVYLNGDEIQVLDSFGLKGENNECGGFYGKRKPDVNMCLPPLTWQTYDVEFKSVDGKTLATVKHNGVVIHADQPLNTKADAPIGINLQNHGNPVVYRNIWIVERKPATN